MSDVRETSAPTVNQHSRTGPNPEGDFIWYELMTTDADGAKSFYDAVVGWDFGEGAAEYQGYRMINTRDGAFAGGVMPLTDEMQQHGARPTWLGYLNVADVDEKAASIEAAGGKTLMGPMDIPNVGRIAMLADPARAPFYVMKPIPPAGREDEPSTVFSPTDQGRCAWNELSSSDPVAARRFYGEQFGWTSDDFMDMGEHGEYRFIDHHGLRLGAIAGTMHGEPSHWRFYFRVPSVGRAKEMITCLWFDKGEARKAAEFYASVFPDTKVGPAHGAPSDFPGGQEDEELTVEFTLLGRPFVGLNGGPNFKPNEAVSFMVLTENQEETDRYWNAITQNGGQESACGWCKDRWGYSWQITPRVLLEATTNADKAVARRAFEAMMDMTKIDVARIEAAVRGDKVDA